GFSQAVFSAVSAPSTENFSGNPLALLGNTTTWPFPPRLAESTSTGSMCCAALISSGVQYRFLSTVDGSPSATATGKTTLYLFLMSLTVLPYCLSVDWMNDSTFFLMLFWICLPEL